MKACLVVEIEVGVDSFLQFLHCFIAFKVDVLVLEASPETLNSDIIQSSVFPVHADLYVIVFKNFDKNIRSKLASMVCIEDCRAAIFFDCFPQKICILQCIHGIEYTPAQNFSRGPVDYCHQVLHRKSSTNCLHFLLWNGKRTCFSLDILELGKLIL